MVVTIKHDRELGIEQNIEAAARFAYLTDGVWYAIPQVPCRGKFRVKFINNPPKGHSYKVIREGERTEQRLRG